MKILKSPWPLTGRTRFRTTWRGKLVMEVQFLKRKVAAEGPTFDTIEMLWRDGTTQDIGILSTIVAQAPPSVVIQNHGAPIEEAEMQVPGARKPH